MIVAIDGPVAAGKTTVANRLASILGYSLLDTGAIYRSVALACRQRGVELTASSTVTALASSLHIEFRHDGRTNRVYLDDEDVTEEIRAPEMSEGASVVSALPSVRGALLELQRDLAASGRVIAEGRDIGTVVFPNAEVKVFLTADPEIRALRRFREQMSRGESANLDSVLESLERRDHRDRNRSVAPLVAADDAIAIDSTHLTIDQVVDQILARVDIVSQRPL